MSEEFIPLPAIPVSAGALIYDRAGRLLILKPTYKSGWTIPGGVMEADGESPWEACQREVREETGLEVSRGRLVVMDFRRPKEARPGGIRFLFDCGQVSDAALAGLKLQPEEISEFRLVPLPDALGLLRSRLERSIAVEVFLRRMVEHVLELMHQAEALPARRLSRAQRDDPVGTAAETGA